jgi:HPt (histidine-containing phosphotransfer) domain-containing protein
MTDASLMVINKAAALERVDGDVELYDEIVQVFVDDAPVQLNKLKDALEEPNIEVVHRQAHSLKSSAANIGAEAMSEVAYKMEKSALSESLEVLKSMFAELQEAFEAVLAEIEKGS